MIETSFSPIHIQTKNAGILDIDVKKSDTNKCLLTIVQKVEAELLGKIFEIVKVILFVLVYLLTFTRWKWARACCIKAWENCRIQENKAVIQPEFIYTYKVHEGQLSNVVEIRNELAKLPQVITYLSAFNDNIVMFADKAIRSDKKFMLKEIEKKTEAYFYASQEVQDDRQVKIEVLRKNPYLFMRMDEKTRSDVEIVSMVVKRNGLLLENAGENCRKNPKIVRHAIKSNGLAFKYADETLKKNPKLALRAIKSTGSALKLVPECLLKQRFIIKAVRKNAMAAAYIPESLKLDFDFNKLLVQNNSYALAQIDPSFRKNEEIVVKALSKDGMTIQFADDEVKNKVDIAIIATLKHPNAATFIPKSVIMSKEFRQRFANEGSPKKPSVKERPSTAKKRR